MRTRILGLSTILLLLLAPMATLAYAEDGTNSTVPNPQLPPTDPLGGLNMTTQDGGNYTDPEVLEELLAQAEASRLILMAAFSAAYGGNFSDTPTDENGTSQSSVLNLTMPNAPLNDQMHGDDAIDKALQLLNQANANAAAQQVKRAMKHYRNALRKAYHDNPDAMTSFEESGNETDPDLPPTGDPDVNQTEILSTKMMLVQQFHENFQQRLMSMEENVYNLTNRLSDKDAQKATDALEKTERKLLRIQERLNRGEIDEAMDELQNATDGLDDDLSSFEDAQTGQMLRTMNKLEAKVQRMVDKMNRKAARGGDTSGDEDAINQAWGQLKKYQDDFKAGKSGSAPGQNKGDSGKLDKSQGKGKGYNKDE
ncbi:MAG: hypothetical protein JSV27_03655 [Candidatus Bathyarchaeota archaeon]|nr:MAG: hypothetical protein JSV27_03655 [Candidatus Bathyarchaeota archaeon]